MKKFIKSAACLLSAVMTFTTAASAADYITLSGFTDSGTLGVTVLITEKGADLKTLDKSQIIYVNQSQINNDGTYYIKLPLGYDLINDYSFFSNMTDYTLSTPEMMKTKTIYVSENGDNANDGESPEAPLKTLAAAYEKNDVAKKIVIMDDTTYATFSNPHGGAVTIEGYTPATKLILPASVTLNNDLTLDNLTISNLAEANANDVTTTIYASGYKLKIGSGASSEHRMSVCGGSNGRAITGDTDITLLGGKYFRIYGGGNGSDGVVNGNTNVVVGADVNPGDGIDDDASNISPCYVFGGGNNAAVTGQTNVTLKDNAAVKYLVGAGYNTNGTASKTNISIEGGKVMNVYAGGTNVELTNCDTHVKMTGGLAEAIFGGSEQKAMTGNAYIELLGGDVSRRVYTGCYNGWSLSWSSDRYLTGTTTLVIGPDAKLITKTGLSSGNAQNMGVFAGSRTSAAHADEVNTVIFLDDCYSTHKGKIGAVDWTSVFKSFESYAVKAGKGGTVKGTNVGGKIYIEPDMNKIGKIGDNTYSNEEATVASAKVSNAIEVTFTDSSDFAINNVTAQKNDDGVSGNIDLYAPNNTNTPSAIIAVYDENGTLIAVESETPPTSRNFDLKCALESGKTYTVKAMIWDSSLTPLTTVYQLKVH